MGHKFWSVVKMLAGTGAARSTSSSYAWQVDAGCWLEASVPLHVSLFIGLFIYPHGSFQSEQHKRAKQKCQCLLWCSLRSHHHHLLCILLVTQISRDSVGEETIQRYKYQTARIVGGHFGDWLPHLEHQECFPKKALGDPKHPGPGKQIQ